MAYLGNTPTTQNFVSGTDYFNGTGAQTAFTLSRTVASVNDIQAVVNNVVQVPNDAYTISGTTITFTSAPSAGTQNVYVRYLSTTTQAITPSQGTVSWSTLDSNVQGDLGISFKNRIINSNMVIDQRNAGASVTAVDGTYTLDRWQTYSTPASKFSVQQNAGSVTPPIGFKNYLGATSLSAYSVTSNDYFTIGQPIEGLNVADLEFGTANAKTITVSFWVRSSLTGTFGAGVTNSAFNRSFPFSYTISSANTWEQKSVTIAGDTSGTWLTNNGRGLELDFGIGVGSTNSGTAGSWQSGWKPSVTGATSVVGTNGATFYITGVQLEVGTQATTFTTAGGSYGAELALCQRYFSKSFSQTVVPADGINTYTVIGTPTNTSDMITQAIYFPVTMRTPPTITFFRGSVIATSGLWSYFNGSWQTPTGTNTNQVLDTYMSVYIGSSGAFTARDCLFIIGNYTASAEL
jgi:hypothetical protein